MENLFNVQEFEGIKSVYGNDAKEDTVTLNIGKEKFFLEFKNNIENDRRGEVAFVVQRKNGKIIVVRTNTYPEGIYRIPTGGISHGEDIVDALYREVKEELGLEVQINCFLGVIKYDIVYQEQKLNFYSYVFYLKELSGNILEDALEDEVSEYREMDKDQLRELTDFLDKYEGTRKDWCQFRSKTTGFILPYI